MRWLSGLCVVAFLALSGDALFRVLQLREALPEPAQLRPVQVVVQTVESGRRCSAPGKRRSCWQELKLVAEDGQWWWLARLSSTLTDTNVAAFVQPGERVEVGVYASTVYTLRRLQRAPSSLGLGESREIFSDAQLRSSYAAWSAQHRLHLGLAVLVMLLLAPLIWRWRHQTTVASLVLPIWVAVSVWFIYPAFAGEPFPERADVHPQVTQFAALGAWVDCAGAHCKPQAVLLDQQQKRWPLSSAATMQVGFLQALKPGTPITLGMYEGRVYSVAVVPAALEDPSSNCGYRQNKLARTTQVTWQCGDPGPERDAGFMEQLRHAEAKKQQTQPAMPPAHLISYEMSSNLARELRQASRSWPILAAWGLFTLVMACLCFHASGRIPIFPDRGLPPGR